MSWHGVDRRPSSHETETQAPHGAAAASKPRTKARLTIRLKLFAAFALLAIVGGSGGVLSLLRLMDLGHAYQGEQSVVAAHEALHQDRIALISLQNLVNRSHTPLRPEDDALRDQVETRMSQLRSSTETCAGCHSLEPAHVEFAEQLESLRRDLEPILSAVPAAPRPLETAPLQAVEASIVALEERRAQMEASFHRLLAHRRGLGRTILYPGLWPQVVMVGGGLTAALLLAWLMSRAMSRSVLPLIAAARGTGSGGVDRRPIELPRDPELAQIAAALDDMAALVAQQAREDARRQLFDRTISSQEDERKRLARELHDTLGQSLLALLMEVKTRNKRGESETVWASGDGLEARISALLDDVRRMAWDLRPSLLDDLGLRLALGRFTEEMARRNGTPIDFQTVGLEQGNERLPGNVEIVLYRVAQEALSNVARHAHASRTSVVLVKRGTEVALLVEDDGMGFDIERVRNARASLGILGMEERVALVGGNLTIASTPGQGTSVRAQVPLAPTPT